jgi:hypothetical protein
MEEMPKLVWQAADFDENLNWKIPIAPSPRGDWVSGFQSVLHSRVEDVTGGQWSSVSMQRPQSPGGAHVVLVKGLQKGSEQILKETLDRFLEQANHDYLLRQAKVKEERQRRDEAARDRKSEAEEMRRVLRDN